jgi:hypothetical protein
MLHKNSTEGSKFYKQAPKSKSVGVIPPQGMAFLSKTNFGLETFYG